MPSGTRSSVCGYPSGDGRIVRKAGTADASASGLRQSGSQADADAIWKAELPFLDEMGLINERLMAIHLSVATEEELQLLAKKGAAMVLCSGSEAIVDGNIPLRQN